MYKVKISIFFQSEKNMIQGYIFIYLTEFFFEFVQIMSFKKHLEQVCSSGYMFTYLSMIQILIHVDCPQITMPSRGKHTYVDY